MKYCNTVDAYFAKMAQVTLYIHLCYFWNGLQVCLTNDPMPCCEIVNGDRKSNERKAGEKVLLLFGIMTLLYSTEQFVTFLTVSILMHISGLNAHCWNMDFCN